MFGKRQQAPVGGTTVSPPVYRSRPEGQAGTEAARAIVLPEPPGPPPQPPASSQPERYDPATTVIVRRASFDKMRSEGKGENLVFDVVQFVNNMQGYGHFIRYEISQRALQAYHTDFYLAQVNNGGHSQFIHNAGSNYSWIVADVRAALAGMQAPAYQDIFERMVSWVQENPEEAAQQTGFNGGRAAILDELDKQFYALGNSQPLADHSGLWISGWPGLVLVESDDYPAQMEKLIALNPLRQGRLINRSINSINHQVTDHHHLTAGYCCSQVGEYVEEVFGHVPMKINGQEIPGQFARAVSGRMFAVAVATTLGIIFESRRGEGFDFDYDKRTSGIMFEGLDAMIGFAGKNNLAAGVDLLFRNAGLDPSELVVTPHDLDKADDGEDRMQWFAFSPRHGQFIVGCVAGALTLIEMQAQKVLGTVMPDEVARHLQAAQKAAGIRPEVL